MAANAQAAEFKFRFPDFSIGTAEFPAGPTGCTVFSFPKGAIGAVDVRGGASGLREAHSLMEENSWGWLDALVFAGGSTYGLESASGVAREILKKRKSVRFSDIPSVPAAIVYDFSNRDNFLFPSLELGATAFHNARENIVNVGRFGAGANVSVGKFLSRKFAQVSGQGAAFFETKGYKFFAFTVVNALGNVLNRRGEIIRGSFDAATGKHLQFDRSKIGSKPPASAQGNTTISALITNAPLNRGELRRLAVSTHTAMARVIEPFHTADDGDSLFAISTNTESLGREKFAVSLDEITLLSAQLMQDAVINAVENSTTEKPLKK